MAQTPRVILRNPPAEKMLAAIYTDAAIAHKMMAKDILRTNHPEMKNPATFYWRGRARAKQAANVDAIPIIGIARPPATIAFTDADKGFPAAEAAEAVFRMWKRLAPVRTGVLAGSLDMTLNGKPVTLTNLYRWQISNPFSKNEEVWIYPTAFYAAAVEAAMYTGRKGGLMYKIWNTLRGSLGSRVSVQFAYIQGKSRYALPAIRIGAPGAFPSTVKGSTPGRNRRRKARKKRTLQ